MLYVGIAIGLILALGAAWMVECMTGEHNE
jgi:hypothetical protein